MEIKELYKKFLKAKGADPKYKNLVAGKKIDVSKKGLWDKKKKQVIVPSNRITMKGPNGEQDFFKRPIVATGLQSGQKVVMQPGGEYYFPNDKAVHEVRMQKGGKIKSKNKNISDNPDYTFDKQGSMYYKPTDSSLAQLRKIKLNKLNPTLEEVIKVAGSNAPIDATYKNDNNKIVLPPSRFSNQLVDDYVKPNVIGKPFGVLEQNKGHFLDEGYSPSRVWANIPMSSLETNTRNLANPNLNTYFLEANKDIPGYTNIDYSSGHMTYPMYDQMYNTGKELVPKELGSNDSEQIYNNNWYSSDNSWNRARQLSVEMQNNPEIREWAKLHNVDLSSKPRVSQDGRDKTEQTGEYYAPKLAEQVLANRGVSQGDDIVGPPLKNYERTRVIQNPSAFNLVGYADNDTVQKFIQQYRKDNNITDPHVNIPSEKQLDFQTKLFKQLGIKANPNNVYTHFNRSTLDQYTPGMQGGGSIQTDITTPIHPKDSPTQDAFNTMMDKYEAGKTEEPDTTPEKMGFAIGGNVPVVIDALFSNFTKGAGKKYAQMGAEIKPERETSTEETPDRMGAVEIQTKQDPWYERYPRMMWRPVDKKLHDWGSKYAKRISDATGGENWYKQPNSVLKAMWSTGPGFVLEAPQLTATYGVTGKVQTPSEAMDIKNPYGALAVDMVLDPLAGPALAKGVSKGLTAAGKYAGSKLGQAFESQVIKFPKTSLNLQGYPAKSVENIKISPGLREGDVKTLLRPNSKKFITQDQFFQGLEKGVESLDNSFQKRIADLQSPEGYRRLVNQEKEYLIQQGTDATVAERVAKLNAKARIEELKNTININKEAGEFNKTNISNESNQFVDNPSLYDNAFYDKNYKNSEARLEDLMEKTLPNTLNLRKPFVDYSKPRPGGIGMGYNFVNNKPIEMHEIAHALQRGRVLPIDKKLRQITPKKVLNFTNQNAFDYFRKGSSKLEPSPFANELREAMYQKGFIPDYYSPISENQVQNAYKYFKHNPMGIYDKKTGKFLSNTRIFDFMEPSKANSKLLTDILNELPAVAPVGVGLGLGATQLNKKTGMQKGGSIILDKQESQPNKEAMTAMMKSKIAYGDAFRNPTTMRMTNRDPRSYTFTFEDEMNGGAPAGSQGNVYVGSYGNRIIPGIQDVNGQLKYIAEPFDDKNIKRTMQQSIQFDSPEDAEYFGEHYKEIAPMMHVWGKQEMQMGGMSIPGVNGTVVASTPSLYTKAKARKKK